MEMIVQACGVENCRSIKLLIELTKAYNYKVMLYYPKK